MAWTFSRAQGSRGFGTALPGSPVDGDEFTLVDNTTTPTYAWRLRYNAAKASNKWQLIGGSPLMATVDAAEATTSNTYVALTTAGPTITVPVAGDYLVRLNCRITTTSSSASYMSYDIGGTGAVDADAVVVNTGSAYREQLKTALAASTALTAKYHTTGAFSTTFDKRVLAILPVAIGG